MTWPPTIPSSASALNTVRSKEVQQAYRDALIEYLALNLLQEELRGDQNYELRNQVSGRRELARQKIEKVLLKD